MLISYFFEIRIFSAHPCNLLLHTIQTVRKLFDIFGFNIWSTLFRFSRHSGCYDGT